MEVYEARLAKEYLLVVQRGFENLKSLGEKTMQQLSDADLHWQPDAESNSIAVIVKHMSGNMISRWTDFLETDGEKEDRNRDNEFIDTIATRDDLMEMWEKGWGVLLNTLGSLQDEDLLKTVYIRSESHSVIQAIERQVSHYAYHVGQMVYIGKQLKSQGWTSLSIPRGKSDEYRRKKEHN